MNDDNAPRCYGCGYRTYSCRQEYEHVHGVGRWRNYCASCRGHLSNDRKQANLQRSVESFERSGRSGHVASLEDINRIFRPDW